MKSKRLLLLLLFCQIASASPWMTGPLLAPAGRTVPVGHVNFEPYGFYTLYPHQFRNVEVTPVLTTGVTSFIDVQASLPLDISWDRGQRGSGIGDTNLGFGVQILRQKENSWLPDLRIVVQEVFPTGKYQDLNPTHLGTDQTGAGSYQTFVGFNFQRLSEFSNEHYLRTRFSFVAATENLVHVHGFNVYGGSATTNGIVRPDNSYSADLAFEYALTQNWVGVFEGLYVNSGSSRFTGNPGFTPGGTVSGIGGGGSNQGSLAPAIEYNFSAQLGLIFGVWFSVTGPQAGQFVANSLALNWYF